MYTFAKKHPRLHLDFNNLVDDEDGDENNYRNFAYPIVAQTKERRERLQMKFEIFDHCRGIFDYYILIS